MSSTVTQQRMEVEQLRREAAMKRIPVSQAVDDIKVMQKCIKIYIVNLIFIPRGVIIIFENCNIHNNSMG